MSPKTVSSHSLSQAGAVRACEFCRVRKIKCDTIKPRCASCTAHDRQCVYTNNPPRQRPSRALVNEAHRQKHSVEKILIALKNADGLSRDSILSSLLVRDGCLDISDALTSLEKTSTRLDQTKAGGSGSNLLVSNTADDLNPSSSEDDGYDLTPFISRDECGTIGVYGPSSVWHAGSSIEFADSPTSKSKCEPDPYRLIAYAALQRQTEYDLRCQQNIAGIPSELAMHLLDLHWNRQHHTFLLTYRPAFMRDLLSGGPYCSEFLINAVFACSSKFSERLDVRSDITRPETAGKQFFDRCDQLLAEKSLLAYSSISTVAGLLMLGSTFNARGQTSKGWLYTGYALRMVYDLGLHLDCDAVAGSAEDIEVRRRVFWAAFICDKLQSLYFGRPFTIQLRDVHVSRDFMDTFEENELWTPYVDPQLPGTSTAKTNSILTRIHSISVFQQLCSLSKLMTSIIDRFYVVGATGDVARKYLDIIDRRLSAWYRKLPQKLRFEPWVGASSDSFVVAAPNVIILLTTYNALIILLHRPFISSGHLRSTHSSADSWERCITAARNITRLALSYRSTYSLRQANYMLSYAVYVACTIHARNPTVWESTRRREANSPLTVCLRCLDELAIPNCGVSAPARIIRRLMDSNGIPVEDDHDTASQGSYPIDINLDFQSFSELTFDQARQDECLRSESFQEFPHDLDLLFGFMNEAVPSPAILSDINI